MQRNKKNVKSTKEQKLNSKFGRRYRSSSITVFVFFRYNEYETITGPFIFNLFDEILSKMSPP